MGTLHFFGYFWQQTYHFGGDNSHFHHLTFFILLLSTIRSSFLLLSWFVFVVLTCTLYKMDFIYKIFSQGYRKYVRRYPCLDICLYSDVYVFTAYHQPAAHFGKHFIIAILLVFIFSKKNLWKDSYVEWVRNYNHVHLVFVWWRRRTRRKKTYNRPFWWSIFFSLPLLIWFLALKTEFV